MVREASREVALAIRYFGVRMLLGDVKRMGQS